VVAQRQVEYERYLPSDSDPAYPRGFSTRYDDCRKQWRGVHGIILDAGNDGVGVRDIVTTAATAASVVTVSAFWEREVSSGHHSSDRTYVQDLKNVFEVQPPGGDRLFIFLRAETLRDRIPFTPLDQLPLDICHCPAIERVYISGGWWKCVSLARPTASIDLSHHTRTD
jgi:hypothetical protein